MARSPAGQQLDLVNIMSYDAGNIASTGFDPKESLRAHRLAWPNAAVALGVEVRGAGGAREGWQLGPRRQRPGPWAHQLGAPPAAPPCGLLLACASPSPLPVSCCKQPLTRSLALAAAPNPSLPRCRPRRGAATW